MPNTKEMKTTELTIKVNEQLLAKIREKVNEINVLLEQPFTQTVTTRFDEIKSAIEKSNAKTLKSEIENKRFGNKRFSLYNESWDKLATFETVKEAVLKTGYSNPVIYRCLKHGKKTKAGYYFKFDAINLTKGM